MTAHPIPGEVLEHVQRLAEALQATGRLTAQRRGNEILVDVMHGSGHMSERVTCRPDDRGELCYWWSWGMPITAGVDDRPLPVAKVDALVERIGKVVGLEVPNR